METYTPLYVQLANLIIEKIQEEEYLPGERLPSERQLAETYKINRVTVRKAVQKLIDKGYLRKDQNRGTYISNRASDHKFFFGADVVGPNKGLSAFMQESGMEVKNKVIEQGILKDKNFFASKLSLDPGEEIYYLFRLRSVEGESIVFEQTYVPLKYFPDIDRFDFSTVSLYDYMRSKGHNPVNMHESMTVEPVIHPIERLLGIDLNQCLYVFEFTSSDQSGTPVEYTLSYTRPDRVNCVYRISSEQKE